MIASHALDVPLDDETRQRIATLRAREREARSDYEWRDTLAARRVWLDARKALRAGLAGLDGAA